MSTIQLLEAKFDGIEQRIIRVEADVALLKVNMTVLQSQMNLTAKPDELTDQHGAARTRRAPRHSKIR